MRLEQAIKLGLKDPTGELGRKYLEFVAKRENITARARYGKGSYLPVQRPKCQSNTATILDEFERGQKEAYEEVRDAILARAGLKPSQT